MNHRNPAPCEHPAIAAWTSVYPQDAGHLAVVPVDSSASPARAHRIVRGDRDAVVIAKYVPDSTAKVERCVYETMSRRLPEAIPRYVGGVADQTGTWIFTEETFGAAFREDIHTHREALGLWLARVHAAAESASELRSLPSREPDHYRRLLDVIRTVLGARLNDPSGDEPRHVLVSALNHCDRLSHNWAPLARVAAAGQRTLVHGDLVAHNVFIEASPTGTSVVAIDWEKAGWGSPAEDLSSVDLRTYALAASELGMAPVHHDLEALALAGRFFRCVVFLDWVVPRLHIQPAAAFVDLAQCSGWLSDLDERASW